ncbi:hypothetical protein ACSFA2_00585 [Variovorax sp. LT2P21]|uniref:hypothetical protein n=1 Tax=Variovorax sp. LT2P21 TaxID=3443731 RepID=UPI003F44C02C
MWVFLPGGSFISVVQKVGDEAEDLLTIRARTSTDLVELRAFMPTMATIERGGGSDYGFRVVASRSDFAAALAAMSRAISYPNFKDHVKAVRGPGRSRVLQGIWGLLRRLQQP